MTRLHPVGIVGPTRSRSRRNAHTELRCNVGHDRVCSFWSRTKPLFLRLTTFSKNVRIYSPNLPVSKEGGELGYCSFFWGPAGSKGAAVAFSRTKRVLLRRRKRHNARPCSNVFDSSARREEACLGNSHAENATPCEVASTYSFGDTEKSPRFFRRGPCSLQALVLAGRRKALPICGGRPLNTGATKFAGPVQAAPKRPSNQSGWSAGPPGPAISALRHLAEAVSIGPGLGALISNGTDCPRGGRPNAYLRSSGTRVSSIGPEGVASRWRVGIQEWLWRPRMVYYRRSSVVTLPNGRTSSGQMPMIASISSRGMRPLLGRGSRPMPLPGPRIPEQIVAGLASSEAPSISGGFLKFCRLLREAHRLTKCRETLPGRFQLPRPRRIFRFERFAYQRIAMEPIYSSGKTSTGRSAGARFVFARKQFPSVFL